MAEDNIKNSLASTKVADRKKAAKNVGKNKLTQYGDELWDAYQKQKVIPNSWEAQIEMINALGLINYKPAKDEFFAICKKNLERDMITVYAAMAYLRLDRKEDNDISPAFELIGFGKFSVIDGALRGIAADKVIPADKDISTLIAEIEKIPVVHTPGYADIREGLACACAGWPKSLTTPFLNNCLQSPNSALVKVAEKALKGKYSDINLV